MDKETLRDLLANFGRAFFNTDSAKLRECTTTDVEWHQHVGPSPTGTVLEGVGAICKEVLRRKRVWRKVIYKDFDNRFLDDLIVSSFLVSGINESGRSFSARAVDLYQIEDGKISRKDSYWKQEAPEQMP